MSQRLSMISEEDATGIAKEVIEASNHMLGRSANLLKIIATHSPYVARWWLGFVAAIRQPNLGSSTDVRLRNLASVKTSIVNECAYCTAHTRILGESLGLSKEEFEALQSDAYKTCDAFSRREKAAIAWAEAMTLNTAKRDAALWEEMKAVFTETEIVEISMAIGLFNIANRLNDSFWTELESDEFNRRQGRAMNVTVETLEDFAATFRTSGDRQRKRGATSATQGKATEPGLRKVTDATFDAIAVGVATPILLEFTADWCASCRAAAPMISRTSQQLDGDFTVLGASIDESEKLAARFGVRSIPTAVLLVDSQPVALKTNLSPSDDLAAWARASLANTAAH
ncbi:MAG: thioredoxin domain-containing protein [Pseudorhodoplanes sp.]|uniref:thioredoxin domain-containing protein n=1 Tax=Pseudorhodoplanes sp. TaxID=1934341 RepID=UPI003D10C902